MQAVVDLIVHWHKPLSCFGEAGWPTPTTQFTSTILEVFGTNWASCSFSCLLFLNRSSEASTSSDALEQYLLIGHKLCSSLSCPCPLHMASTVAQGENNWGDLAHFLLSHQSGHVTSWHAETKSTEEEHDVFPKFLGLWAFKRKKYSWQWMG